MEQGLLPKNFFKNEPLEEMSTAIIAHFSMTALFADRLETAVDDILSDKLTTDRKVQIAAEKVSKCDIFFTNDKQLRQEKELPCMTMDDL